ncbi:hypothetical protein [Denitrobaculum tricleocarpae]|uniref:Uncharacterized protein n=1 Tax=Denitrobaculum tricleocarpae TaxID=2591009 RepID=A0A545TKZ8_9PROT|nr:hypothetical protein [Denitrobaculum tricleocarpae]TQV77910.1 hypothetical protein FKG95_20440 [Denitrobaculum tricleocarpae]
MGQHSSSTTVSERAARLRAELECLGLPWSSQQSDMDRRAAFVRTHDDLTRRSRLMAYAKTHCDHRSWLERSAREHTALKDHALSGDVKAGCALLREHTNKSTAQADAVVFQLSGAKARDNMQVR